MAFYFFDASALVKYYVTEPGSSWVRHLIEQRDLETHQTLNVILVAEISRVEVAAGLAIIERVGRIRRAERDREYRRFTSQLAHRYAIIPLATTDIQTAADLTQHHPLRAYDAVQLAVALRYRQVLAAHQFAFVNKPLVPAVPNVQAVQIDRENLSRLELLERLEQLELAHRALSLW